MSGVAFNDLQRVPTPVQAPLVPSSSYNGWTPDWRLALLNGLDAVRWGGPPRREPLGNLLDIQLADAEEGIVTFSMPLTDWARGFDGSPVPGMLAVLADHTLAASLLTTFPPMRGLITIELDVTFLELPRPDTATLTCTAKAIATSEGMPALAQADVNDGNGRTLARASTRCHIFEIPDTTFTTDVRVPEPPDFAEIRARAPTRTIAPAGEPVPSAIRETISGIELLDQVMRGELAPPPIYHLTGVRPVKAAQREATFTMPASRWMGSFTLNIQGGVIGLLAEQTACGAVATTLLPGEAQRLTTLRLGFMRPVATTGEPLLARAGIVHRGRSVAFSSCQIATSDGTPVAFAAATHAL